MQLLSTLNFKRKDLSNLRLFVSVNDVDFSGFDFRHTFIGKSKFTNCDFTDADISGSTCKLNAAQLRSTYNYKRKDLSNTELWGDLSGLSFAGFDLRGTQFRGAIVGCDFTDADISGADFDGGIRPKGELIRPGPRITTEQLYSTRSFKERNLGKVVFRFCQLQGFDFSSQCLGYFVACDLTGAKFDSATFSRIGGTGANRKGSCGVSDSCNLSIEQFSLTRTFKSKRLPKNFHISKELKEKFDENARGNHEAAGATNKPLPPN